MTQGSPFDPSWFNACIVFGSSPMIMMCCPTWNSLPLPIACDLFGTHLPLYLYEIPTLCTLGVRPAVVSLMPCFTGRVRCRQMTRSEPVDGAESRRSIRGYEATSSDSQSCAPTRPCRIQDCAQFIIRRRKITPSPQAGGNPSWGSPPQYSWREGFATPRGSLPRAHELRPEGWRTPAWS